MSTSELALVVSAAAALATVLGLLVAFASLRLSASSIPLEFRFHLDEDAAMRVRPEGLNEWLVGRLVNAGPTHKVVSFRVTDWKSDLRGLSNNQLPRVTRKGDPDSYPNPEEWKSWGRRIRKAPNKAEAWSAGIFYPQRLSTGEEMRVQVKIPPHVKKVELTVGVTSSFATSRAHSMWVENPLFDPSTGRAE